MLFCVHREKILLGNRKINRFYKQTKKMAFYITITIPPQKNRMWNDIYKKPIILKILFLFIWQRKKEIGSIFRWSGRQREREEQGPYWAGNPIKWGSILWVFLFYKIIQLEALSARGWKVCTFSYQGHLVTIYRKVISVLRCISMSFFRK